MRSCLALVIASMLGLALAQERAFAPVLQSGRVSDIRSFLSRRACYPGTKCSGINDPIYGAYVCNGWYLPRAKPLDVAVSCDLSPQYVRLLLDNGAKLTYATNYDYPVLSLAASNNNPDLVRLLLDYGATTEPELTINAAYSALMVAAEKGHNAVVNLLLDRGVPIDGRDNSDRRPLHYAAKSGQTETCRLLLDRGADIDSPTIWAMTPLSWAAYNNHRDTYRFLLRRGANKRFCVYPMCNSD